VSDERIKQIRERLEAATPGPWSWHASEKDGSGGYPQRVLSVGTPRLICECYESPDLPATVAPFIANAPSDIAYLLERVERLRAALEDLRDFPTRHPSLSPTGWVSGMRSEARRILSADDNGGHP